MITKKDFIKELAKRTGYNQNDVSIVMSNAGDLICEYAKQHETVKPMNGFTFEGKISPARVARNPQTGETVQVSQKNKIVCRFGTAVKDAIQ